MRVLSAAIVGALLLVTPGRTRAQTILDDPRAEPAGQFGRSLAAVGEFLAVGAPGSRQFGNDAAGVVQVFDAGGFLRRTIVATNPVSGAALGIAMVADATRLFVGAPGDRPIGVGGLGAVYVFDGTTGGLIRAIRAPDPNATTMPVGGAGFILRIPGTFSTFPPPVAAGFGRALATGDGLLVVGAPESRVDDVDGAGAVFVLDPDGVPRFALRDFPARPGAAFGAAVAVAGNFLVVGAPGMLSLGGVAGAGEVLLFDAHTGNFLRRLDVPLATEGAALGASLRVLSDLVFAGAPGERFLGVAGAGAVHAFDLATGMLRRTITPPAPVRPVGFGAMLGAIDADLLVGAPQAPVLGVAAAGTVFRFTGSTVTTFIPTRPRAAGSFGQSIATFGSAEAIGEPAPGTGAAGRVYVFAGTRSSTRSGAPSGSPGGAGTSLGAGCPQAPTLGSVECRLGDLLSTLTAPRLAGPLRRALASVHRARGRRRVAALLDGERDTALFLRRLERARGMTAGTRADAADVARSIGLDLGTLAQPELR